MQLEDLMTMQEAAAQLQVRRGTLYYAIAQGRLHPVRHFGRTLLLKAEVATMRPAGYIGRRPSIEKKRSHQSPAAATAEPRKGE